MEATAPRFSWKRVSDGIFPEGSYVGDVINQHGTQWCGCCYVVSVVQMVEDRYRICFSQRHAKSPVSRHIDMQTILDHFVEETAVLDGWNACHGGFPLHVIRCIGDRECPVVWTTHNTPLLGYARGDLVQCTASLPFASPIVVSNPRRVLERDVRELIARSGPVVLEVNGDTLKSCDASGIVRDLTPALPNHAVTVVGWEDDLWIVRNSWGSERVPREIPSDLNCVKRGVNDCRVDWVKWSGTPDDPGYVLLPRAFPPLHTTDPSPWIVADVTLA